MYIDRITKLNNSDVASLNLIEIDNEFTSHRNLITQFHRKEFCVCGCNTRTTTTHCKLKYWPEKCN